MATETKSPDVLITQTNLTGSVTDIQDDPDSPDSPNTWLSATSTSTDCVCHVSFPTPTGNPTTGAGLQEFRVLYRNNPTGRTADNLSIFLYENGTVVGSALVNQTDPADNTVYSATWNAADLGTADGSLVECYVTITADTAPTPQIASGDIGAIEWNVEYDASDDLTADNVASASAVTTPDIGQVHILAPDNVASASNVTAPDIGQVHDLAPDNVASASATSTPSLTESAAGSSTPLIIPDPRFEMPELLTPKRQPTGRVAIDWGHPLSMGLHRYWPIWEPTEIAKNTTVSPALNPYVFQGRRCVDGDNTNMYSPIAFNASLGAFTCAFWFNFATTAGAFEYNPIIGEDAPSGQNALYLYNSGTFQGVFNPFYLRFQPDDGATLINVINKDMSSSGIDTGWHYWVVIRDSSNNCYAYVDNVDHSAGNSTTGNWDCGDAVSGGRIGEQNNTFLSQSLCDLAVWSRALSDAERISLTNNPYQFLIPA